MLDLTSTSDEQLLSLVARGDASALERLYERYMRQCFGLALRMLSDTAVAEEVVQDVYLKLWTHPTSYASARGKFSSWLLSLVHHRCIDLLRRRSSSEVKLDDPVLGNRLDTEPDTEMEPPEQVWQMEQRRVVRAALLNIPQAQREAIELAYFRGLSHSEVAQELGQPLGTVKTRIRLGMMALRGLLEPLDIRDD